jgi:hypothetical protein
MTVYFEGVCDNKIQTATAEVTHVDECARATVWVMCVCVLRGGGIWLRIMPFCLLMIWRKGVNLFMSLEGVLVKNWCESRINIRIICVAVDYEVRFLCHGT